MELLYLVTTILSLSVAIFAWWAKIKWSKEYTDAKNEIIKSKEAQIDLLKQEIQNLKDFSPIKMREYFVTVKQQLEEYNEHLKSQLDKANKQLNGYQQTTTTPEESRRSKQTEMKELRSVQSNNEVEKLNIENKRLKAEIGLSMLEKLKELKRREKDRDIEREKIENILLVMQEINSLKDHPDKAKFIIPNLPDGFLDILSEAQQALKTWGHTVDLQTGFGVGPR